MNIIIISITCLIVFGFAFWIGVSEGNVMGSMAVAFIINVLIVILAFASIAKGQETIRTNIFGPKHDHEIVMNLMIKNKQKNNEAYLDWMKRLNKIYPKKKIKPIIKTLPNQSQLFQIELTYKCDAYNETKKTIYSIQTNESEIYKEFLNNELNILYNIKNIKKYNKLGILK